ncbi:MAG: hypothetical protein PHZ02_07305 [Desulfocapsaceae bacterium]|nr:hypothetical protein [Desulfocapsaceae bacterium]
MTFSMDNLLGFLRSRKGLAEKVVPTEEVFITMTKAPQVLCFRCGSEVCYVKDNGQKACPENFAPLSGQSVFGWDCPQCGQDIRAWLQGGAVIKTNKGILQC